MATFLNSSSCYVATLLDCWTLVFWVLYDMVRLVIENKHQKIMWYFEIEVRVQNKFNHHNYDI